MIRLAERGDARALAGALARAFYDDPLARYAYPRPGQREKLLRRYAGGRLRTLLPEELVFCDSAGGGAALWAPPDRWKVGPLELLRHGPFRRFPLMLVGGAAVERKHPSAPHYYLSMLGVEPAAQGRGLGSRLLRPMLDRMDEEGVPGYLESSNPRNLDFYARHGFRVTGEVRFPRGPVLWLMWREPLG